MAAGPRQECAPLAIEIAFGDMPCHLADLLPPGVFRGEKAKNVCSEGGGGFRDWTGRVRGDVMPQGPGLPQLKQLHGDDRGPVRVTKKGDVAWHGVRGTHVPALGGG